MNGKIIWGFENKDGSRLTIIALEGGRVKISITMASNLSETNATIASSGVDEIIAVLLSSREKG